MSPLAGLVLLIGPPGAGKSTFARQLIADGKIPSTSYISNDAIARELFGLSFDRGDKDGEIFAEQDRRIAQLLSAGRVAVVDATNVKPLARKRLLDIAAPYKCPITALCFRRDIKVLLRQNRQRENVIPENFVLEYAALMDGVTYERLQSEGFTTIIDV